MPYTRSSILRSSSGGCSLRSSSFGIAIGPQYLRRHHAATTGGAPVSGADGQAHAGCGGQGAAGWGGRRAPRAVDIDELRDGGVQ
eukprot:4621896-Prymnesium_polylepis.1